MKAAHLVQLERTDRDRAVTFEQQKSLQCLFTNNLKACIDRRRIKYILKSTQIGEIVWEA